MSIWGILKSLRKNYLAKFYSLLTDRKISDKEYEDVLNLWNKFDMKTVKDYHDLYLKKYDILLLADVFGKFRNNSLKNYGLCPSYYLSAPCLSWDAMLKMTKIKLEFIPDLDKNVFFEKGTRGGISYISSRYSNTNNIKILWPKTWIKTNYKLKRE